ncbi:DUF3299 domain-containing protein [Jannaschia donghaensis]|nr:DUF3299 domain-containing protein [Jannaschia donghaensis]
MAACVLVPGIVRAETVVDLTWADLLPEGEFALPPELQDLIDHDGPSLQSRQPVSGDTRPDWNGQVVRLPGFIVPIDYSGTGVTAFILVPYVGACVHVPPPPANQLVLVTTERPYESSGLFEAVHVTGMFGTASTSTALADIGYALSADEIRPYRS